jgi:CheY-like chemotaxis protein
MSDKNKPHHESGSQQLPAAPNGDSPNVENRSILYCGDAVQDSRSQSLTERNTDWLRKRQADQSAAPVLIADDSEADIFFLLRAFATANVKNPIYVVRGGAEAMQYLAGEGKFANRNRYPAPKIVLLDLKMPAPDGLDVLRWKQQRSNLPKILWVALSNFDAIKTINEAYAAGATTFLTKPLDGDDIRHLIESFDEFWVLEKARVAGAQVVA